MQNNDNKLTPADAQMAFHYYSSFFKAWEKHNQWFVIDFSKEPYRTNVLGLCQILFYSSLFRDSF